RRDRLVAPGRAAGSLEPGRLERGQGHDVFRAEPAVELLGGDTAAADVAPQRRDGSSGAFGGRAQGESVHALSPGRVSTTTRAAPSSRNASPGSGAVERRPRRDVPCALARGGGGMTTGSESVRHWADVAADAAIAAGRPVVVSSGISPSGEIHVGNMREV